MGIRTVSTEAGYFGVAN